MVAENSKYWGPLDILAKGLGECDSTYSAALAVSGTEILGIAATRGMQGACGECSILQTKKLVPGSGIGGKVWQEGTECANAILADTQLLALGPKLRMADLVYVIGHAGPGVSYMVSIGLTVLHREQLTAKTTEINLPKAATS